MQKKTLAIVTSYGDLCGNAEYSDVLKKGLDQIYDVTIIPLNMDIMRFMERKAALSYVKRLAEQLREFDYVNIQFESGLFGILPRDILKRFFCLSNSSRKLIVTMHRVDVRKSLISTNLLKAILGLKAKVFLTEFMRVWRNNKFANVSIKVSKFCAKKNVPIIVHTRREKNRILSISHFKAKVNDHPLAYLTTEEAQHYRNNLDKKQFLSHHNLPEDAVIIGTFGFIAPYKGIPVLMDTMPFLPLNYHVLVFGSQHPLKISDEPDGDYYIKKYITHLIGSRKKLKSSQVNTFASRTHLDLHMTKRFHFLGGFFEHRDFIQAMTACDVIVFPYNEVGQSASGVLGLALDLKANIICSQTLAFLELIKYAKTAVRTFSIGNHLELAEKIQIAVKNGIPSEKSQQEYNQKYNLTTNAKLYSELFEEL